MGQVQSERVATGIVPQDRFGERAVKLGFCLDADVREAIERQAGLAERGKPHKLIGLVLLDMGVITNAQLIRVLKTYEEGHEPLE
jgi:hypothetical protein